MLCKNFKYQIIKSLNIQSNGFSIEVETMAKLILGNYTIEEVKINYASH